MRPFLVGAALVLVGAAGTGLWGSGPAGAQAAPRPSVVLVVGPGLRWSTAPRTLDAWGRASLALRPANRRRAGAPRAVAAPGPLERSEDGVTLRQWPALVPHDRRLRFGGHLGELGQ